MAEEIKNENIVSEAPEGVVEAMHDAPKKGSGKAEPMQKGADYEDLGPAVTSPTDKVGQDKSKDKVKKDASAPTKGATPAEPMKKLQADKHMKAEGAHDGKEDEDEKDEKEMSEKEHEMPKTKSGMIQAMYDMMNKKKKSEIAASYGKMMAAMNGEEEPKEGMHDKEDEKDDKEKKWLKLF